MASLGAAAIMGGSSLLSGIAGGKGAAKAAKITAQAYQKGIDEQNREFGIIQGNEKPYMDAGLGGLSGYGDLVGTNGSAAQQTAIAALKASPLYTSLFRNGQDTILQNAAATGGLRGGNTQSALANFGSDLLSQVIQNQLGNLGGLVNTGLSAASGTNTAAMNTANQVSDLLGKQGGAQAMGAAAPYGAFQQALGGLSSAFGNYFDGNANGGVSGAPVYNGQDWNSWVKYGW